MLNARVVESNDTRRDQSFRVYVAQERLLSLKLRYQTTTRCSAFSVESGQSNQHKLHCRCPRSKCVRAQSVEQSGT